MPHPFDGHPAANPANPGYQNGHPFSASLPLYAVPFEPVSLHSSALPSPLFCAAGWPTPNLVHHFQQQMVTYSATLQSVDERGEEVEQKRRNRNANSGVDNKKRNMFTPTQVAMLERTYREKEFINRQERIELAQLCGLLAEQVKIWFQNKRYKERKRKRDERFLRCASHSANNNNGGDTSTALPVAATSKTPSPPPPPPPPPPRHAQSQFAPVPSQQRPPLPALVKREGAEMPTAAGRGSMDWPPPNVFQPYPFNSWD